MPKKVIIETTPATYSNLTGIGYYLKNTIENISNNKNIHHNLYYFNFLGRKKYDLVLYTNYVALNSLRKTKYGLFIYDMSYLDCPEFMNDKNKHYLQKFCSPSIQNSSLIITISEFTKKRILHHFPDLSAHIVVTPIPPIRQLTDSAEKNGIKGLEKNNFILFVGTVEPRKNLLNLLSAYELLDKSVLARYKLVIAGGSGWKNEEIFEKIKQLQNNGLEIIVTGYISDEEKSWLYENCACFTMPSHYEGFGMPILEAMQYRARIASSDIEVFREIAGSSINYFDKDNPGNIAECIEETLETEPDFNNYKNIIGSISWAKNANIINTSIEQLLGE